ncbi:hypothetical protein ACVILL_007098 [Bradyrhizobium sp. USDA 3364]
MSAYDNNNPFAKILRGEFPSYKVYENEHVLAFLDIMPRSPGHTLVIPKAPARNILDISPDDYAHVARAAHKIAAAGMKAFEADGITVQQFNRARRRPGRLPSPHARDAAQGRCRPVAAREPQGRRQGARGACREVGCGVEIATHTRDCVARMKRSAIQDSLPRGKTAPDFASLHPGYGIAALTPSRNPRPAAGPAG